MDLAQFSSVNMNIAIQANESNEAFINLDSYIFVQDDLRRVLLSICF